MKELIENILQLVDPDEETEAYLRGRINDEKHIIQKKGIDYLYDLVSTFSDKKIKKSTIVDIFNKHMKRENGVGTDENKNVDNQKLTEIVNLKEYWKKNDVVGYYDPFLGIQEKQINYNTSIPISESIRISKEKEKQRQKQLNLFKEWVKNKIKIPSPVRVHNLLHCSDSNKNKTKIEKMYDIRIDNFTLSIGQRSLLTDTTLKINVMNKYGLIGKNGIGKSTLLAKLARYEIEEIKKDISIACIEQDLFLEDVTVLECVLMVDKLRHDLLMELEQLELKKSKSAQGGGCPNGESKKGDGKQKQKEEEVNERGEEDEKDIDMKILNIYEKLNSINYLEAEKEASKILCGLGFDSNLQKKKVNSLSGGMRMRLCLSRILFSNNDIILLDEPTNHLDIYTIQFLIDYIKKLNKTCIIVSHDRDFLNEVCTDIIHFHQKQLTYYSGNYDQFEKTRVEHLLQQQREHDSIEMKKKHVQKFIDRFRCNSKRAALVQSRIKLLNKLPVVNLEKEETPFSFSFLEPFYTSNVLIRLKNISFKNEMFKNLQIKKNANIIIADTVEDTNGKINEKLHNDTKGGDETTTARSDDYQFRHEFLFKNATFEVDMDSRIAICGVNGSGKTTLIKIILNLIDTFEGELHVSNKANIGYYSQYHVDSLNPIFNSIQQLQYNYSNKNIKEEEAIKYFNKFNIPTNVLYEPIYVLSGGQKSKLALAILAYKNPNILILDEPSNHLDIESVQALIVALNLYKGGLIIISHDTYLIKHVADEIYHINNLTKELIKIDYDFDKYAKLLLENKI
ncbi:protein GCN20, putative [Plasmodium knowlesi strain H]|uniref:Protein GCN20, putative n=3 Tax=Plasmodium knowlesi TaxID=5850 RepID=A0A5K1U897_PLAKH|nr:ABC transporter F family member 2, putative [Plasmodium knowlesi strain H]OTN65101.1 putative Elongation factor 3 related protein [Plasmodium knowlesi]CAA9988241.1 ABC transporter F family member 2, putative [Plasmodium knowlesi strain H]SBO20172.1 protein GCN20, putative [Plasmodium knowlesi strain H]SBO20522.1 protein GCN20, putative [Plasmodium knowlesi strain H]VVS77715.1 ABC transporter F family member 2, putative [Plasmodium knowlesi strain H]|eukprot:XP_002259218.1 Elongation factor 3 related protein, putative [Plasmodium knowlesi strain H]